MTISIIVAQSKNGIIGKENTIPWRLPSDLKNFKAVTTGKPVIMGRKTFESIGSKPLPNRINIVLSKDETFLRKLNDEQVPGLVGLSDLKESLQFALSQSKSEDKEIFVIGGTSLFKEVISLGIVDRAYISTLEVECPGDTTFPDSTTFSDQEIWHSTEDATITDPKSYLLSDIDKKPLTYRYQVLFRKKTV